MVNLSQASIFIVPPVLGGIIGYFTNDLAIKMLFRPYKAKKVGKFQLPFTPGLIPRNQERLAQRVSDTIMQSLLTPEELQKVARRLLKTERIEATILWLLQLALAQVKADTEQKTAKILAGILRDFLGESLPRILRVMARREDFLEPQLNQIFDQVMLEFQLSDQQAQQLSEWLLERVIPPEIIRLTLIDFLTDRNISIIDEGFREQSTGTYWVVANIFGLRTTLTRLRTFCLDEKEETNRRLEKLLTSLGVRERFKEWLQNLSMQNLPLSTVRQLRKTLRDTVREYVQEQGIDLIQGLTKSIDWERVSALILRRLQTSPVINNSLGLVSQELAMVLERYLEEDLEKLVAKAIPILNLDGVIIERVMATSPQQLEVAVNGIVKSELQGIVNLGGILGVIVGSLQTVILLLR
ncbi:MULTISPECIES: DUF445 domain-containing protein [Arthrospira]|jgi:uncharacterized membrane protein YheB (UPF0754 family)|uniref:Uncharacterized protein n=1 Tax=Limnospira platensis NIES-46 TaxID=1236695 RepID=A0A5M3T996_LIMPL|nr:DUF445 family protein [Arthrospira platensis]AMW29581.1 hypothetical protein AP285_18280 [Arthrospira platensis YZ]KDR58657.1 membrane protein [Arthrospira platensis str. Paraca]MBD2670949.1 DUF445 family protein [Arthrospira platensis FACHB-439]MBD2711682.1 DUF445 family protein [Arthrospira platensis FACHB-835]MDF2212473.1 DUF445 family protein [Arthrospira platensis NCB002]MDT9184239.1 DUF445 family protein [Limnospira sp. PMC 289.06]MDT9296421.1 DUF445 family protein [Arthrospira plat